MKELTTRFQLKDQEVLIIVLWDRDTGKLRVEAEGNGAILSEEQLALLFDTAKDMLIKKLFDTEEPEAETRRELN